jgi:hypothetical protein
VREGGSGMSVDPWCAPGGPCPVCNEPEDNTLDSWLEEEGIKDEVDDMATQMIAADERIRQLTAAAADCARATVVALDRLILAENVCLAVELLLADWNRLGDGSDRARLYEALSAWRAARPS